MIPINAPYFGNEEISAVVEVLRSGQVTSQAFLGGEQVRAFEQALASYVGTRHAVALNSGTAALQAALVALGMKAGDEVLVPSFSFAATANVVIAVGAKPVFVDVNPADYTIDPQDLRRKITRRSRAVMPVHLYGYPAAMREIVELAETKDLDVIEDAAQSLGATYGDKQAGSIGAAGCFSFFAGKVVTTGEGGAVTTNCEEVADTIRHYRNHGSREGHGQITQLGANLRMPEIQAALGRVQLQRLHSFLAARRRRAELLTQALAGAAAITVPEEQSGRRSNWYLYTIRVQRDRDRALRALHTSGIDARVYYDPPIHRTPFYRRLGHARTKLPKTERLAKEVLSLPVHPQVPEDGVARIGTTLRQLLATA